MQGRGPTTQSLGDLHSNHHMGHLTTETSPENTNPPSIDGGFSNIF